MENTTIRRKRAVTFSVDPALLEKLEDWRAVQEIPPSKTGAFELAIREFLEKRKAA